MSRHVFPTAPSPTTTHLMVCMATRRGAEVDVEDARSRQVQRITKQAGGKAGPCSARGGGILPSSFPALRSWRRKAAAAAENSPGFFPLLSSPFGEAAAAAAAAGFRLKNVGGG